VKRPRINAAGYGLPVAVLLGLALLWEAAVIWFDTPEWILPGPAQILTVTRQNSSLLAPHVWQTLQETLLGLALALTAGVALAALLDLSAWLRQAIYPLLVISQTIPILALAPLLIIWFGFGLLPKVLIVALVCFFPIAVNTADGLTSTDPDYVALLRSMGANRRQIWLKVRLPASLPYFFSGLRIAATYSVIGAIIGEWVGAGSGLGIYMLRSANAFKTAQVFSTIAVSSAISLALFGLVSAIERVALPWYHSGRRSRQWESN